jgi:hypothetical protein
VPVRVRAEQAEIERDGVLTSEASQ